MTGATGYRGSFALPRTGHALPQTGDAAEARAAAATEAHKSIFIDYKRQQTMRSRINILRLSSVGKRDVPLDGRRLSEVSQAGKSRLLRHYAETMNKTATDQDVINPWRVLYFELKGSQTLKMFLMMILKRLGDPHWQKGNADEVQERARAFMRHRGVELLIIDEVQHLVGDSQNKMDITDELKLFLDAGIVPVVFAGNEKSRRFFEKNDQLSARLGSPLELSPLRGGEASDRTLFKTFCRDLDLAMCEAGSVREPSGLDSKDALKGLFAASGGHVGRVCRIVEVAVEHAALRDADHVELYDLAFAVETFAIPQRYTLKNPFA